MDKEPVEVFRQGKAQGFTVKAIPSPPGKKFKGKHLFPYEDPSPIKARLFTAGIALAALVVGLLIGRFLLP